MSTVARFMHEHEGYSIEPCGLVTMIRGGANIAVTHQGGIGLLTGIRELVRAVEPGEVENALVKIPPRWTHSLVGFPISLPAALHAITAHITQCGAPWTLTQSQLSHQAIVLDDDSQPLILLTAERRGTTRVSALIALPLAVALEALGQPGVTGDVRYELQTEQEFDTSELCLESFESRSLLLQQMGFPINDIALMKQWKLHSIAHLQLKDFLGFHPEEVDF